MFRNKTYAFLNLTGLALGMAVAILNGLWIWDELSFNKNFENYDRIARVGTSQVDEKDNQRYGGLTMSYAFGEELIRSYTAEFSYIARVGWNDEAVISSGEKHISARGNYVDESLPEMFSFKMIFGSRSALKADHSVILTQKTSRKLFGDADPVGRYILINDKTELKIAGVVEDIPLNAEFSDIEFFAPFKLWVSQNPWIQERAASDWRNHFIRVYVELLPGTKFESAGERIRFVERDHVKDVPDMKDRQIENFLYPMSDWHLYPVERYRMMASSTSPSTMVWLVGITGAFVLLLACINFMNLSTARAEKRAKEVGIRKTIGSGRVQLIGQFFFESFVMVSLAFGVALLLTALALPWFNQLSAKEMFMPFSLPGFWIMSAFFIGITGLAAGSYPALFLSSFAPAKVLKGTYVPTRGATPRKILVVFQFCLSVILAISSIVIYRQVQFAKDRPIGYNREGVIAVRIRTEAFLAKFETLRDELKLSGAAEEASGSMGMATQLWSNNNGFTWGHDNRGTDQGFGTLAVTYEHGATIGWKITQGRDFSREIASDSAGLVVNESAARVMGFDDPIGEQVVWHFWSDTSKVARYHIVGVIKDMVMESAYGEIRPTVFFIKGLNGGISWMNIRLNRNLSASEALTTINKVFMQVLPSVPFEYKFTDEEYSRKFAAEERIGKLAAFFGSLALVISCLGLFGLASFVASRRTKEVGIRKVLGASLLNLLRLLLSEFLLLTIIACVVAVPLSIYLLNQWLQKFAYRIGISWTLILSTCAAAIVVTLLAVAFQSIRAALTNPANSLRSE
jgi:hypothetical protein